jgi:apolipoprotein N-acyltransferase
VNWLRKAAPVWPWLAAVSSGLLATACFAPFNQAWLCWFCLTPLIAAIWFSGNNSRRRWLRDLLLGYVAGLAFFWTVLSWLTTVTVLGWFVLQFYMAIYFAAWGWFCGLVRPPVISAVPAASSTARERANKWSTMLSRAGRIAPPPRSPWLKSRHNLLLAFLLASAWTMLEWLRGWVFSGWGWNGLGVALHRNWLIIQIAEFTGVAGLSFAVAFANVIGLTMVRRLILEVKLQRMRPHYDFTLTMSAIVGLLAFGWHVMQNPRPAKSIRIAAVQANIPRTEKFDRQFTHKIFEQFTRLSQIALQSKPPPDLLIWPESSMPGPVLEDEESYQFVMSFSESAKVDVLLGTIDVEDGHDYNAALLVSDAGRHTQLYRKLHLVPFGEYVPGRHSVPLLAQIVGDQVPGDFDVGKDYTVFRLTNGDVQVAPLICFEDTIGELTRRFVQEGANLLANVTNDGWFLRSAGSQQHLANAIFRCVETRRPMVRAANTGVTCFVNDLGRVTQILQDDTGNTFTEGVLTGEVNVPTGRELTFYARHGELFAKLCACVTLIAVIALVVRAIRR